MLLLCLCLICLLLVFRGVFSFCALLLLPCLLLVHGHGGQWRGDPRGLAAQGPAAEHSHSEGHRLTGHSLQLVVWDSRVHPPRAAQGAPSLPGRPSQQARQCSGSERGGDCTLRWVRTQKENYLPGLYVYASKLWTYSFCCFSCQLLSGLDHPP